MAQLPTIKVDVTTGNELTIRTGDALKVYTPENLTIGGRIDTPSIFYHGKKENYDWSKAHVEVHSDNIFLKTGEHETVGTATIMGTLRKSDELLIFKINSDIRYTHKDLAKLLKMNRIHFLDRDENFKVVTAIETLKLKVSTAIENGNDLKGNKKTLFERQVEHEMQLQFKLNVPIYQGQESMSFVVDICFDVTDGSTLFWLESVDLKELQDALRTEILAREIAKLEGLTIMYA